eukprot:scaffold2989_cov387-Prasinococcus_capsulatus_cf.AAC.1
MVLAAGASVHHISGFVAVVETGSGASADGSCPGMGIGTCGSCSSCACPQGSASVSESESERARAAVANGSASASASASATERASASRPAATPSCASPLARSPVEPRGSFCHGARGRRELYVPNYARTAPATRRARPVLP